MSHNSGVIYVATGEDFIREAEVSASSLSETNPSIPIAIFVDDQRIITDKKLFDEIIEISQPEYNVLDKVNALSQAPYEKSLYLDTDTYICGDIKPLLRLLNNFGMVLTHAPQRKSTGISELNMDIPEPFTEFNGGVIGYNLNNSKNLLDKWNETIERQLKNGMDHIQDQPALKKVVYESDINFTVVPPEYNCRLPIGGYVHQSVIILHGRYSNRPEMAKAINEDIGRRVYTGRDTNQIINLQDGSKISYPTRGVYTKLRDSIKEDGIADTARKIKNRLTSL